MARIQFERLELPDDLRHLFDSIRGQARPSEPADAAECSPPMDVIETDGGIEVFVDLPGAPAAFLEVVFARNVLLVSGHEAAGGLRALSRGGVSHRRAHVRAVRAGRPPRRGVRRRARDRHADVAANCASRCRGSKTGGAARSAFPFAASMRILFIGDIFGKPGREIARRAVPALIERESLDFVIANVENSAAGFGVTGDIADTILSYGVDAMTTGNHVWDKKEILDYIPRQPKLLRPANFPAGAPGRGRYLGQTRTGEPIGVINVMGRIFMQPLDDPFAVVLKEIEAMRAKARVDHRRLPRRGDIRENCDGLASRRPGHRGVRHAHARADRRRTDSAEGHRVPHRCRA